MRNATASQGGIDLPRREGSTLHADDRTIPAEAASFPVRMGLTGFYVANLTIRCRAREGGDAFLRSTRMRVVLRKKKTKVYRGNLGRPSPPSLARHRVEQDAPPMDGVREHAA